MSVQSDKLLATLAKMRGNEAQHLAEKALVDRTTSKFQNVEAISEYTVSYPYAMLPDPKWKLNEGIIIARELEMSLQVQYPVLVGLIGATLTMGYTMEDLMLAVICPVKSRKPRLRDVLVCIEEFGLIRSTVQHKYKFGDKDIIIHYTGFDQDTQ